jgi:hypothetical protein
MAGDTVAIVPPPVFEAGLACEAFGVRSSNNGGRVESNISQMGSLGFWDPRQLESVATVEVLTDPFVAQISCETLPLYES